MSQHFLHYQGTCIFFKARKIYLVKDLFLTEVIQYYFYFFLSWGHILNFISLWKICRHMSRFNLPSHKLIPFQYMDPHKHPQVLWPKIFLETYYIFVHFINHRFQTFRTFLFRDLQLRNLSLKSHFTFKLKGLFSSSED